jgi:hypothetical protein
MTVWPAFFLRLHHLCCSKAAAALRTPDSQMLKIYANFGMHQNQK